MIRSLCVSTLLLLSAVAHGSKDRDTQVVELAKRTETDTRTRDQLVKRVEAGKLARRHPAPVQIQPPHGKLEPNHYTTAPNLDAIHGKPGTSMDQRYGYPLGQRQYPYPGQVPGQVPGQYYQGAGYPSTYQPTGVPVGYGTGASGYVGGSYGTGYGSSIVSGYDDSGMDASGVGYGGGGIYGNGGYGTGVVSGLDAGGAYYGAAGGYSMNGVMSSYSSLLTLIQSYQSIVVAGQITEQIAMQQIEQLAIQFQAVIAQFQGCTACLASSGIGTFGGLFSSLFTSFNSLVLSYQQIFPNNLMNMFGGAFSGLNTSLAGFLGVCQSSGLPVNSFFPPPLGSFFSRIGFSSVAYQLQQYGYVL